MININYHYIQMDKERKVLKIHQFEDSLSDKQFYELFGNESYIAAEGYTKFGHVGHEDDGEYYTKVLYVFPI